MALGYIIALVLFGAGSTLFVVGLLMTRQEARERAECLKAFLKTGVAPITQIPAVNSARAPSQSPAEILHLHVPSAPKADAAHALRRAYYGRRFMPTQADAERIASRIARRDKVMMLTARRSRPRPWPSFYQHTPDDAA